MRTDIFYFSGTGNSLKVARLIAEALGGATLLPIPKALKGVPRSSSDKVGIVFPMHSWAPPSIVSAFIEKVQVRSGAYLFAVATYDGILGGTLGLVASQLALRGLKLSAGFAVKMPGNYLPRSGARSSDEQRKMFAKAAVRARMIASAVQSGTPGPIEQSFFLWNALLTGVLSKRYASRAAESDKKFFTDRSCNGCGLCQRVCPVDNIVMQNELPSWQHHCIQCFACIQWCPRESIQCGPSSAERKRYHHPDITAQDIANEK